MAKTDSLQRNVDHLCVQYVVLGYFPYGNHFPPRLAQRLAEAAFANGTTVV